MQTTQYLAEVVNELNQTVHLIRDSEAEKLINQILESKKIFVAGAGRSGLMGKSFVMRMMHMGIDAYVVGETVTANLEKDDLLIIGSGSGETKTLVAIAEKAKSLGGTVAVITISPESTIAKLADIVIKLPGATKDQSKSEYKTIQPMGSLFEQTMLLFYDALILRFMKKKSLDSNKMYGKHANLE
ncbi:3-hexulose-6-phosphate isomerase [Alkalihalobacillus alcalophilus ATCC 27647 = CGMCC 1.3604]|uniref:3-hexulose-6-phosphate isomerase n=1 Tax=Alkalihalobacillus alcalophilus ATCC 27647 = CGMCC 1.3604 TaxID=1218173 RepID=A0A094WG64_ALKAL|nr:6-phospho-3-hexuloisomerase [Alkalihalobacillus alcalophilus]KGA95756.1 6-phospho 3-hexuloisomerase [Alkalihalobacillus alcalophilus ATCC 27647 = CGMCC 1.3604]MED1560622.1 6-phospho-3-hexuloisomerase [Alkalihalobacillus alcalophilus]THG88384.1 3-hexulose-6-phosphate isomerase [Alkalihalobacillus alcalophilus ATCC 27647 = CGMCC 1.3604]